MDEQRKKLLEHSLETLREVCLERDVVPLVIIGTMPDGQRVLLPGLPITMERVMGEVIACAAAAATGNVVDKT